MEHARRIKNEAQNHVKKSDVFHCLTVEHTQQSCLLEAIQKVCYTEFS